MGRIILSTLLAMLMLMSVSAERILVTKFNNGASYWAQAIPDHLQSLGYTVDVVNITAGGQLATALGTQNYSQVYLYDHLSTLYLNSTDTSALANFFNNHRSLVIDTRSYGFNVYPSDTNQKRFLQNIAAEFSTYGGGVWVGVDHATSWTNNGNAFLSAINVNPVTGSYSGAITQYNASSPLFTGVTPTSLWTGSISNAPTGLQPNGLTLQSLAGSSTVVYVSGVFNPVPEVSTFVSLFIALGMALFIRKH